MKRKPPKPDYALIERLEVELGIVPDPKREQEKAMLQVSKSTITTVDETRSFYTPPHNKGPVEKPRGMSWSQYYAWRDQ